MGVGGSRFGGQRVNNHSSLRIDLPVVKMAGHKVMFMGIIVLAVLSS